MSNEEMQRTMQFIIEQQAQFSVDIQILKETQAQQAANIDKLGERINSLTAQAEIDRQQAELDRQFVREGFSEIRDAVGKLVDTVENTRDFAQQVARLAIASEKRLTVLESRLEGTNNPAN